ncbi:MAG: ABC transporter permease [Chloroflexaceae bacterium]|nr:ABC transporter permease [Chloroflexaceae bacterium]
MEVFRAALTYALEHQEQFTEALIDHLLLVGISLAIGIVVCLPLGVLTSRSRAASITFINAFNALRVIPSLAILFIAIPFFGLRFESAIIALTILALPPILINTDAAFRNINPAIKEAALGMGMTMRQSLFQVEIPLALPVVIAGIRTATVEVIASATLAAFIGIGGLGIFITRGFAMYDPAILLVGAVPVALLAILAEVSMGFMQRILQPPVS